MRASHRFQHPAKSLLGNVTAEDPRPQAAPRLVSSVITLKIDSFILLWSTNVLADHAERIIEASPRRDALPCEKRRPGKQATVPT